MNNDLEKKIADDLEKSGFASEMKVVGFFRKRKWSCDSSIVYFDQDDKKSRELDFRGIQIYSQDNLTCEFVIFGEVKKSQSPWVVFKKASALLSSNELFGSGILCVDNLPILRTHTLAMTNYSPTAQNKWQGYGIHETFKNPDQPSRWFSAFVSVSKAVESSVMGFNSFFADQHKSEFNDQVASYLGILRPAVILDGNLYGAELSDDGQLIIDEIPYTSVKFEYQSPNYARGSYTVDLVSLNSLESYIELCEKQQKAVVNKVLSGLSKTQDSGKNQKMTLEQALEMRLTWEAGMPFFTFFS